ncbi:MAG: vitamin B12-dependent ribonucleotide reductase [Candidatus Saccharimonadales bacterium]|jgi:ribonucleoside-diphosphate reductase alpha chain
MSKFSILRHFTQDGVAVYDMFDWQKRDALISNPFTGETVFEQKGAEFPQNWSVNAVNIVSQKYFSGTPGTPTREHSLKQLVNRVADTITDHGKKNGYFIDDHEAEIYRDELKFTLTSQRAAFNSPVWFNIGVPERSQQASACFILKVEDTMESILEWYKDEGMIFKGGSGAGTNLGRLRSSQERLGGSGGYSSGPVSFMRGADSVAGTIKSGGKTRRAAKMVILDIDHPDIEEFIWCKAIEERKSRALAAAGFDMDLNGKDAFSVQYQNANNSVRVTDDFMNAVENDQDWQLKAVKDGRAIKTIKAKDLWRQIAESAWECADPGLQFDTTINNWHTTPNEDRINASNPCSEYMHIDNSACNLASINLLKFLNEDGSFDIDAYKHVVKIMFIGQEILVGYSEYPTAGITKNAKAFRQLGLGYANLGALLMAMGLPYDSDEGRNIAASLTSIMTGYAYEISSHIASRVGPFLEYTKDADNVLKILKQHQAVAKTIPSQGVLADIHKAGTSAWDSTVEQAKLSGVRNAQATVLAPTGTIAFMMDCDTTGIEPDLSLVKTKKLVGGGTMSIVNQTISRALRTLGYSHQQIDEIIKYIDEEKTIIGAPHLKNEHTPVFACSMGDNIIDYMGHIKMMSAVQPFLSGAISKTVNLPEDATAEDIENIHMQAWKLGLKAVAVYRDNCKFAQPLSTTKKDGESEEKTNETKNSGQVATKHDLPKVRPSKTYEFKVGGVKGFLTVGEYDDGRPGEIFINVSKQGSTLSGLMDSFAISVSHGLRYGVPLRTYVKSLMNSNFAPFGATDDPSVPTANSIIDYIVKKLAEQYLPIDDRLELNLISIEDLENSPNQTSFLSEPVEKSQVVEEVKAARKAYAGNHDAAPLCSNCGNITQRAGSCYICTSCGSTSGCS